MRRLALTSRRAFSMVGACVLLVVPVAAAADPSLSIGFASDGQRDLVLLDHRPPILQVSLSASSSTQDTHETFNPDRRPHVVPATLTKPNRHAVDDNDTEMGGELSTPIFVLALCASPRAPALEANGARTSHTHRACASSTSVDPFIPRPPPARDLPL